MLLGELLLRRKCAQLEIHEFKNYLYEVEEKGALKVPLSVNDTLTKLFELEDKFQRYTILVERANNDVEVTVGSSQKTSVANTIKLRNAVDNKISVLSELIKRNKASLNIINLIEQRQKLIEEFILLDNVINASDWSLNVD